MSKIGKHLQKDEDFKNYTLLKRIFWAAAKRYRVGPGKWANLMTEYTHNPMNVERQTSASRNQAANNLADAVCEENITFLQLIRGLKVLKVWRIRITFELWKEDEQDEPPKIIVVDEKMSNLITRGTGSQNNI